MRVCFVAMLHLYKPTIALDWFAVKPLKGLCYGSLLDVKYTWTRELRGNFYLLRGYSNSDIFYDGDETWRLQMHHTNSVYATTR